MPRLHVVNSNLVRSASPPCGRLDPPHSAPEHPRPGAGGHRCTGAWARASGWSQRLEAASRGCFGAGRGGETLGGAHKSARGDGPPCLAVSGRLSVVHLFSRPHSSSLLFLLCRELSPIPLKSCHCFFFFLLFLFSSSFTHLNGPQCFKRWVLAPEVPWPEASPVGTITIVKGGKSLK